MTHLKTSYYDPDGRGRVYNFWRNLIEHIHETHKDPDGVWQSINKEIAKYNGKMRDDHIEFINDSDATMFLLRWS